MGATTDPVVRLGQPARLKSLGRGTDRESGLERPLSVRVLVNR
jgi:hypothetical protein